MKRFFKNWAEYLTASLFITLVIITFMQVIFRYVLNNSLSWSGEASRYLFVWISLFGSALAVKRGSHIAMEALVDILPPKAKKWLILLGGLCVTFFVVIFTRSGIGLMQSSTGQSSTALGIPMPMIYIAFPASGLIMFYYIVKTTYQKIKGDPGIRDESTTLQEVEK